MKQMVRIGYSDGSQELLRSTSVCVYLEGAPRIMVWDGVRWDDRSARGVRFVATFEAEDSYEE